MYVWMCAQLVYIVIISHFFFFNCFTPHYSISNCAEIIHPCVLEQAHISRTYHTYTLAPTYLFTHAQTNTICAKYENISKFVDK